MTAARLFLMCVVLLRLVAMYKCQDWVRMCFFTNWAQYRPEVGRFMPSDVNASLCSHIVFAFAKIVSANTTIAPIEYNDVTVLYPGIQRLKSNNPKLRILLSIGGALQNETDWTTVTNNNVVNVFSNNVVQYLRLHNFDGVDIDWETPNQTSKGNYIQLMQALRLAIDAENLTQNRSRLILTTDVVANVNSLHYYTPSILVNSVDFINLMAYDFTGDWSETLGHHSPLFVSTVNADDPRYNTFTQQYAVQAWLDAGTPSRKLILGLSSYGRTFLMSSLSLNRPGDTYTKKYPTGAAYTRTEGIYAFYEVCQIVSASWTVEFMQDSRVPYAFGTTNNQSVWVGFDNQKSFAEKAQFAIDKMLGGVMVWTLDLDDFTGKQCGQGAFPLLQSINSVFNKQATSTPTRQTSAPDDGTNSAGRSQVTYDILTFTTILILILHFVRRIKM